MTPASVPLAQNVVLIGGGHSHALLLRRWGMKPVAGARLTLINPAPTAPYTGMLPGHVAGHYDRDALEIDLVTLARHAGARLILGRVKALDPVGRTMSIDGRPDVPFDLASIDIGITSDMPDIPGFLEHAVSAKPLGPFAADWRAYLGASPGAPIVVIGGGVAGVELALAMRHRTRALGKPADVTVIDAASALGGVTQTTRSKLLEELDKSGITLVEHTKVTEIKADHVTLDDGTTRAAHLTIGAAGARPFDWLQETGLDLTDGYITVDETLRSTSHTQVYAAGDCAHLSHAPRPKAGVFAVRAAPILTHNLRADLTGGARRRFKPQSSYLKLISLGAKRALTDKWGVSLAGDWVWTWKDRIDRKFMDKLSTLPDMASGRPKGPVARGAIDALGDKPLCGGCGAKVGSGTLDAVLETLPQTPRDDIRSLPGDDAAILGFGEHRQVISTDHLRAFWDDPYLMSRIAAVHALGDVWAMGATPQALLAQIILPRMAEQMQSEWLTEIMAGATDIAQETDAAIVGGHTTLGAELTIGFTVTGRLDGPAILLSGAKPGEALILTRPIGSGTILAAEMAKTAKGTDVAATLAVMAKPQGDAAQLLAGVATAMTDVTGFGLAGHAARMALAADATAEIALASVPLYQGAQDLAERGVRSSLYAANRAAVLAEVPETAHAALLFDPQTAGGLLAAVPAKEAARLVSRLRDQGHRAAEIGQLSTRSDTIFRAR